MIAIEQIKAARAMIGLSQQQLAVEAGISIATLNNIERGAQTDPKISTLNAIRTCLESHGVEFISDQSGSIGIRLKPQPKRTGKQIILIIDDNKADRTLYKAWLTKADGKPCEIIEADHAKAGYEAFLAHHPSCIILDFMMYGVDGFQLLMEMKRDHANIPPIIFVTGMHHSMIEDHAREHGVHTYLDKKSLGEDDLCNAVEQALAKS